jgi:hypothetical protein
VEVAVLAKYSPQALDVTTVLAPVYVTVTPVAVLSKYMALTPVIAVSVYVAEKGADAAPAN